MQTKVKARPSLKQAMLTAGLTQTELARRIKKSESEISLIVTGKREASLGAAKAIARVLGMGVEDLF